MNFLGIISLRKRYNVRLTFSKLCYLLPLFQGFALDVSYEMCIYIYISFLVEP